MRKNDIYRDSIPEYSINIVVTACPLLSPEKQKHMVPLNDVNCLL
jgi:hypothetical protein